MNLKQQSSVRAVDYVEDGMVVGLGTGLTAAYAIDELGARLGDGRLRDVIGVATSVETERRAKRVGIPLSSLAEQPVLDLVIDGADELDPNLDMIKGLGGALMREKIVEIGAKRFLVVVDASKLVQRLGTRGPLPVEVTQFAWEVHVRWLAGLGAAEGAGAGCRAERRMEPDGSPFVTDNGNFIIHCTFPEGIYDAALLGETLIRRPGILEHGLFLGMATDVVVAGEDGIRILQKH